MSTTLQALDLASRRVSRERLVTTLIFAVLAHGLVILGVGFVALAPTRPAGPAVAVTLVRTASVTPPRRAVYLAQANERGPGNTRAREAAAADSGNAAPFPDPGIAQAAALAPEAPGLAPPQTPTTLRAGGAPGPRALVTTTAPGRRVVTGQVPLTGSDRPLLFARLAAASDRAGPHSDTSVQLPQVLSGRKPQAHARTTDTRASVFAPYLERWRARIEAVGNAHFERLIPPGIASGHVLVRVALNADGTIRAVKIEERSQHPALDAAALRIIRLAAPFPPLPAGIRRRTDVLSFAYRWNFLRGRGTGGSVGLGGG